MSPIFQGNTWINRIIAVALLGIGAAGIGIQATWLAERTTYVNYSNVVQSVTGLATVGTGLDLCIAGAAIVVVGGLLGVIATFGSSNATRLLYIASLLICIVGGIVELAGGLMVTNSSYYGILGPDTYVFNENKNDQLLEGDASKMAMFGLAVFDKCCRPENWESQAEFGTCGTNCPSTQSGELTNPQILEFDLPAVTLERLCTCVQPGEKNTTYTEYISNINTDSCNTLKTLKIDFISDIIIPTTPLSLGFVKNRLYPNSVIDKIPLIGFYLDSTEDPTGQTEEGFGFGCGLGYPKGIMWIQELYHDFYIKPGGSSGLGLGVAALIVAIIAFPLGYFLSREDNDGAEGQWENTLAAKWNDPANDPPIAKVESASVMSSSNPMSTVPSSASNSDAYVDQLVKFYAKHDPLKSRKEIENIAAFAKQNGLAALNKKLKDKYGVDLSGGDEGPPI